MLDDIDVTLSRFVVDLRWPPLTEVMLLASAWWFKAFVFVAIALALDLRARRFPWSAAVTAVALAVTPFVYGPLKDAIGRPRPFAQGLWDAIGTVPASASMPSGHAMTAMAGATALALLHPAVRWWAIGLGALVSVSRVYLGVHFVSDIVVGAAIGAALAALLVAAARRLGLRTPAAGAARPGAARAGS